MRMSRLLAVAGLALAAALAAAPVQLAAQVTTGIAGGTVRLLALAGVAVQPSLAHPLHGKRLSGTGRHLVA